MTDITCSVNGCTTTSTEKRRLKKGMCEKHYRRLQRTGTTADPTFNGKCQACESDFSSTDWRKKYCSSDCKSEATGRDYTKPCIIQGCEMPYSARGMCGKHYRQHTKNLRPCRYEGCDNGSANLETGYCGTHYTRLLKHGDPSVTMKGKAHKVQYTDDGLRICKMCGVAKPDSDYHKDRVSPDGLRAQCKPCRNGYMQSYYEDNLDERKSASRAWREKNIEYARSYDSFRYERDRDKRIELATKQSHIRRARLSKVETDPGLTRSALRKRDGDKCYYCHRVMDFSRAVGRKFHDLHATIEHLEPISRGGSHTFDNCVLACRSCNLTKHAGGIEEFVGYRDSDEALFELID